MGELCERMRGDLEIAGFSPSTSKIYLMYARHFARFHMRDPAELGRDDVREFLLHLAELFDPVKHHLTLDVRVLGRMLQRAYLAVHVGQDFKQNVGVWHQASPGISLRTKRFPSLA
jgi:hypothetical protein